MQNGRHAPAPPLEQKANTPHINFAQADPRLLQRQSLAQRQAPTPNIALGGCYERF